MRPSMVEMARARGIEKVLDCNSIVLIHLCKSPFHVNRDCITATLRSDTESSNQVPEFEAFNINRLPSGLSRLAAPSDYYGTLQNIVE